jgi:phosphatidylglycerophosphatase C
MPEHAPEAVVDRPVAVFDMDGVLVHGDVFGSFVRHRLRRSPAHLVAAGALWPWLVTPVLVRRTRRRAVKAFVDLALAGLGDQDYALAAAAFGAELAQRHDRVVHQAVDEARRLMADGYRVVVATACEERLARAYLDAVGLTGVEVLGSTIRFRRAGPMHLDAHNHGEQKVVRLAQGGIEAPWAVAYTDALSDVPLLRGAEHAVLVNPDEWLRTRVTARLGYAADEVEWPEFAPRAHM